MKIKAAVVREKSGPFIIEDIELDEIREDEVLVRVVGSGVCHTDLNGRDQAMPVPLPAVLGHEGSGVVEKVGAKVTKLKPGDHVVMTCFYCGECVPCKRAQYMYCRDLFRLNFGCARPDGSPTMRKDGEIIHGAFFSQSSFATFSIASERNTVKIPKDVPLELMGPLGCGFQTGAGGVINSLHPHAGSSIAIFGVGSVGLSAILGAVVCGCATIIAVDLNEERLKFARELGATHAINAGQTDPVNEIQKITGGYGADYSLECSGTVKAFRQAVDSIAVMGVCGIIGGAPVGSEVSLDCWSIQFGRTVRGSIEGDSIPDIFIPQLVELYRQGRFPFDRLIKFYPFDQIQQAVEDSERGKVVKAVLRP